MAPTQTLPSIQVAGLILALTACTTATSIRECEDHDQCPTGQSCIERQCVVNVSESCGPTGLVCLPHEVCSPEGTCVCSSSLANSVDACGCEPTVNCEDVAASPIMQMACEPDEVTQKLECICDETYHAFDDGACGCGLVNCEKDGDVCENSECSCVVANHMYDSDRCACGPACEDGEICSAGECICAEGTTRCNDRCIPYGYTCCSDAGDYCPVGTTCRTLADDTTTCQPSGTTSCFHDNVYVGSCAPEETCIVDSGSEIHCLAPGVTPCIFEGSLVGTCAPKETCIVDIQGGPHCVPPGGTPCYAGPEFAGYCTAGQKCTSFGTCIAVDESLCGDGVTICPQGQTCVATSPATFACHPGGTTACYKGDEYYGWNCNSGWSCGNTMGECNLPGWKECPDDSVCSSGEKCYRIAVDVWSCAPNEAIICYQAIDGVNIATGWCPAYQQCPVWGSECVPPGWVECEDSEIKCPQGATCIPKGPKDYTCLYPGSVACYLNNWFHHACAATQSCTPDGCA